MQYEKNLRTLGLSLKCSSCKKRRLLIHFSFRWTENRYEAKCKECSARNKRSAYKRRAQHKAKRTFIISEFDVFSSTSNLALNDLPKEILSEIILEIAMERN